MQLATFSCNLQLIFSGTFALPPPGRGPLRRLQAPQSFHAHTRGQVGCDEPGAAAFSRVFHLERRDRLAFHAILDLNQSPILHLSVDATAKLEANVPAVFEVEVQNLGHELVAGRRWIFFFIQSMSVQPRL